MKYFCTLFDSFYLNRGLVMHSSLKQHCPQFHLYIFAFDETSHRLLQALKLDNVTVISLSEFEDERLISVKASRSKGEYCWTCTSSTIRYCIKIFNLPHCTYVDADLCFYSDPSVLVDEMGDHSVLITEHRYTKKYDQSAECGIYCVQFITFKNTTSGLQALEWWRDRCIEWCYARFEDGKFGDQKYLDDWITRFEGVHVLQHLGGGVAPWNVQQYKLANKGDKWILTRKKTADEFPLIFFHFHYLKFYNDRTVDFSDIYDLGSASVIRLYRDYLKRIKNINETLKYQTGFSPPLSERAKRSTIYRIAKKIFNRYQRIHGLYNNLNMDDSSHP